MAAADAGLVIASLFIADRAPMTAEATAISLVVATLFAAVAVLALALEHFADSLGKALVSISAGNPTRRAFRRLVATLLAACLLFGPLLALVSYAILARIVEGFAVFG
jgi:hypothetical protein